MTSNHTNENLKVEWKKDILQNKKYICLSYLWFHGSIKHIRKYTFVCKQHNKHTSTKMLLLSLL